MLLRSKRPCPFTNKHQIQKRRKTTPFFDRTILVYDIETSNISAKCGGRAVEVACILIKNGKINKTFHSYFNPECPVWSGAYKAHGLSDAFLRCQPPFRSSAKILQTLFDQCDVRCAHNGKSFDDTFLNAEFARAYLYEKVDELYTKKPLLFLDLTKNIDTSIFNRVSFIETIVNAGMMYYFKEYLSRDVLSDGKAGPMMFGEGAVFPNPKTHLENYNACMLRLAYFRVIKMPTASAGNRKRLTYPLENNVKNAVESAELTLMWIVTAFKLGILKENEFRRDFVGKSKMFDTLKYAKDNESTFQRGFDVENLKLDTLLDYYKINRYARESGNHGAAIDTHLLFQLLRQMHHHKYEAKDEFALKLSQKSVNDQMKYVFKKNSYLSFEDEGFISSWRLLHSDDIGDEFGDRWKPPKLLPPPSLLESKKLITKVDGRKVVVKLDGWVFEGEGEWRKE